MSTWLDLEIQSETSLKQQQKREIKGAEQQVTAI